MSAMYRGQRRLYFIRSKTEAKISQKLYFVASILKIQNDGLVGVCANANIDFLIAHDLTVPEMYRFTNLQKI